MDYQENEKFSYTYSAAEQEEVHRIRKKYIPAEDKMEQLRRLDAGVTEKATGIAIVVGIFGAFVMGIGFSCTMVWKGIWFIPGIVIGLIGIAALALAFPVYQRVLKTERKKIAPEVIRLTDALMK
ncbi:MAG: hypothetical protein ACI4V3_06535 [Faecousia sp.]